jgi:hypothetical protein
MTNRYRVKNLKGGIFMKKAKLVILFVFLLALMSIGVSSYSIPIAPFPIGIYSQPPAAYTTNTNYANIKNMNATYVIMGGDVADQITNDNAVTQCANNGLKAFVNYGTLDWTATHVIQSTNGNGYFVSSSNTLGQTFTVPDGRDCAINSVELFIDPTYWVLGTTLTLKIYNSPSKTTLLGTSSIAGPQSTYYPTFGFNFAVTPNSTYYFELTCNSASHVGWVVSDPGTSDLYTGGTAYQNGSVLTNTDFWFDIVCGQMMYNNNSKPSNTTIDGIASHYSSNASVGGFMVKDEPIGFMLPNVFDTVARFKSDSPSQQSYVDLVPDYYSGTGAESNYGFGTATGSYVTPTYSLGESFTTNAVTTNISTIQIWLDHTQWATNEGLTLKIWNSPAKTTLIASSGVVYGGTTTNYPQFILNATVSPNTQYYWELTHNGGGDNSVGWVCCSQDGVKWNRGGQSYFNGLALNHDFWFTINQNLTAMSYEDYVYHWAYMRPDYLLTNYYPWLSTGMDTGYFNNLEEIRRQSLSAQIPFQTFIQSCAWNGMTVPTVSQMRYNIYTDLAYGAQGYIYFLYWLQSGFTGGLVDTSGNIIATPYNGAATINLEVQKLGPTLQSLTSQAVYHTGASIPTSTTSLPGGFFFQTTVSSNPLCIGYYTNSSGRKYIMVVNRDYTNSGTFTFSLNSKPTNVTEISKSTGSEVSTNYNQSTGQLSASFNPGEGKLYAMPSGY